MLTSIVGVNQCATPSCRHPDWITLNWVCGRCWWFSDFHCHSLPFSCLNYNQMDYRLHLNQSCQIKQIKWGFEGTLKEIPHNHTNKGPLSSLNKQSDSREGLVCPSMFFSVGWHQQAGVVRCFSPVICRYWVIKPESVCGSRLLRPVAMSHCTYRDREETREKYRLKMSCQQTLFFFTFDKKRLF